MEAVPEITSIVGIGSHKLRFGEISRLEIGFKSLSARLTLNSACRAALPP
jgi:hypothetical protein